MTVDGEVVGAIDCPDTCGLLALVGVEAEDGADNLDTMIRKIAELRILPGEVSVADVAAPVLLISQFTLLAHTARGRRPSYSHAAPAHLAEPVIDALAAGLRNRGITVETGRFGAMMEVSSVNSGPFTVLVDC